jgi:hypothetical protein
MAHGACVFGLLVLATSAALADEPVSRLAVGDLLPRLEGEFLTGRDAVLPDASRGKVALVAFGFSYDSRFPVEAWMKRFREAYTPHERLTFFEVPMIGAAARLGRWFIDRGMRRGTPRDLHEHVITVYTGTGPWKRRLGVDDDKLAYLVLLDREGRVRWLHAGAFDEGRLGELGHAIEPLLDGTGR